MTNYLLLIMVVVSALHLGCQKPLTPQHQQTAVAVEESEPEPQPEPQPALSAQELAERAQLKIIISKIYKIDFDTRLRFQENKLLEVEFAVSHAKDELERIGKFIEQNPGGKVEESLFEADHKRSQQSLEYNERVLKVLSEDRERTLYLKNNQQVIREETLLASWLELPPQQKQQEASRNIEYLAALLQYDGRDNISEQENKQLEKFYKKFQ